MHGRKASYDKYMLAAIAASAASFFYWLAFEANAYNTFHEYSDLAAFEYSFYFNMHYPWIAHGMQLLVFGNHIVPVFLLIMPIYALLQSAMTLLAIQAFVLSAAGFALFMAARYATKNGLLAFLFALAFLLNPGMHGMLVFDFHAEAFISLFMIMAFYYYLKASTGKFLASMLLMLGTLEEMPILGMLLGLGLLLFEYRGTNFERQNAGRRKRLAVYAIALSVAAFLFYSYVTLALSGSYATSYGGLPKSLYLTAGSQNKVLPFAYMSLTHLSQFLKTDYYSYASMPRYLAFGLAIVFFGFGIAALLDPAESLLLSLPWLSGAFILISTPFVSTWYQYFGFVIAPIAIASIIGTMRMKEGRGLLYKAIRRTGDPERFLGYMLLLIPLFLFAISPIFLISANINNLAESMLMMPNATVVRDCAALNSILRLIPGNASAIAPPFIAPHIANREYLGFGSNYSTWPEYVVVDFNPNVSINSVREPQYSIFTNFTQMHPYAIVASNGTAWLFEKRS